MYPKLVLDTNTIISAFFWEGNESKLFRKIEEGKAKMYTTIEILKEIEDVINRPKFKDVMINYIVSGDKDLLSLKEYKKILIIRTSRMLELLE